MGTEEVLGLVMKNLDEVKESIRRVHERIDEIYKAGLITRVECEGYRANCKKGGYPAWVVVLFSVCSGLTVFIVTKGVH